MQSIKRAPNLSPFPLVPRGPLGRLFFHLAKRGRTGRSRSDRSGSWCLRRNGERAYNVNDPHIIRNVSANVFSLSRFGLFYCRNVRRHVFAETSFAERSGIRWEHKGLRGTTGIGDISEARFNVAKVSMKRYLCFQLYRGHFGDRVFAKTSAAILSPKRLVLCRSLFLEHRPHCRWVAVNRSNFSGRKDRGRTF